MSVEIERKFLVRHDHWLRHVVRSYALKQGYLSQDQGPTVRVRTKGAQGFLTVKGKTSGVSRLEFEYEIPHNEALQLLELCVQPAIEKVRHEVFHEGHLWEIDVFEGANLGLILAEIELKSEQETFARPSWLGEEVSHDTRYFNSQLAQNPFTLWP